MSVRVYVPEKYVPTSPKVFLLESYEGNKGTGGLYEPRYPYAYTFSVVEEADAADLVLLPQAVSRVTEAFEAYVDPIREKAKTKNIPLLAFVSGDLSHDVYVEGCYMLKGTQFRDALTSYDVIVPPICEDLGSIYEITKRPKSSLPSVGFCGWTGFSSFEEYLKYLVKVISNELTALVTSAPHIRARRKGLYFRRKAVRALRKSGLVRADIIERSSFGAHTRTVAKDPAMLRKEFVEVIQRNDFTLAPKGDANYSVRFFETLSLGRIPILIDTLSCLPFEDIIDYGACTLRVPYERINELGGIVSSFYESLTPDDFQRMQETARETFVTHLRYDSFFNQLFATFASRNHL